MKTQPRREDRRTIYTKNVIKDAMLELLVEGPFEKITVAALCRKAEIVRTTFYLHYDGLTDVLKELADDAILAAGEGTGSDLENISRVAAEMRRTDDPEQLAPYMDLLPVCQRVFDDPKYKVMFKDYMVSSLYFLIEIPQIMLILSTLWNTYSSLTIRSMSEKYIFSVAKCFFSG